MSIIAHNMLAMNANRQFNINTKNKAKSTEKLSSGFKINRSADNASGLAISEKMRRQIRGLNKGSQNSEDGISLLKVADGALEEVQDILIRINELSVQAANDTNTFEDRQAIQNEINSLTTEINRISSTTEFNTKKLFNTGYVVDSDYGIDDSISFDLNTFLSSINASGIPTNTAELSYNLSADTNTGLSINSSNISWNNISDRNGNTLADSPITGGTYFFNYNGSSLSFNVYDDTSLDDIVNAINGITVDVTPVYSSNTLNNISLQSNANVSKGPYTILANDWGLFINNSQTNSSLCGKRWNDISFDTNSTSIDLQLSNSNSYDMSLHLDFDHIPTKDDIINVLNGATCNTVFKEIESISLMNISAQDAQGNLLKECKISVSNLNEEFCTEHNIDLYNERNTFEFLPDYTSDTWTLTYGNKSYRITNESQQMLDTINSNGGVADGDVVSLTYSDGIASFNVDYHIIIAAPSSDVRESITLGDGNNNYITKVYASTQPIYSFDNSISLVYQDPNYTYQISKDGKPINDMSSNPKGQWWIQSGDTSGNGLFITVGDMNTTLLGLQSLDVSSYSTASETITKSSRALDIISKQRARIGAQHNRLEHAIDISKNVGENTQYAESRIRDTDMAEEMMKLARNNILEQASQSMIAQANQSTQGILALLQ